MRTAEELLRWAVENLQPWDGGTLFVTCQRCAGDGHHEWSHAPGCDYVAWLAEARLVLR